MGMNNEANATQTAPTARKLIIRQHIEAGLDITKPATIIDYRGVQVACMIRKGDRNSHAAYALDDNRILRSGGAGAKFELVY